MRARTAENASTRSVAVVIVTFNSAGCIGTCLASVRATLSDAQVVVVDNGSHDDTVRVVRVVAPGARVIETPENVGFGRACNAGAEAATTSHVLFLNPDAAVTAVDDERFHQILAVSPFGLLAPAFDGEVDRLRRETSWRRDYVAHTFEALRPAEWRPRTRVVEDAMSGWVSGAMLLVSRDEFLGLGGFDPRFFVYYEDRDLSHRYREANFPVVTTEAIRGRHIGGSSSPDAAARTLRMGWSLLGWIQYVWIHDGEGAARRAARASIMTLRMLRLALHAMRPLRWRRVQRKAGDFDALLEFLAERVSTPDVNFCPQAVGLVETFVRRSVITPKRTRSMPSKGR